MKIVQGRLSNISSSNEKLNVQYKTGPAYRMSIINILVGALINIISFPCLYRLAPRGVTNMF